MRKIVFGSACVGVVGVVIACGGQVTSVDGSKNVGSLSSSDSNQLCNDTFNYFISNFSTSDILKITCGLEGSEVGLQPDAGSSSSSCTQSYQTCLSQGTSVTIPTAPDCTGFAASVASCNTTVDTYSKCVKEEINALKQLEGQLPLCDPGALEQAELQADSQIDATCLALTQQGCNFNVGVSSSSSSSFDGG